ncbi:MAG: hypothetical protein C3F14_08260 [Deltaproteobacteria bacterium]|nr:MAG: hypothetical protein C3F14_08260 [Deltaproteobacteria bacterium]
MKNRWRTALLVAVVMVVLGSAAAVPGAGQAADRVTSVTGVVDSLQGTVVAIRGLTYDLKGVPLRNAQSGASVDVSSLKGKTVEIVFRNRKIVSVTVYRTLPQ